eukprot:CAMPEP_0118936490 /NCGR_PEP_ID=MMETSP1169-20130426/19181_1 /TAXON_ID=36882 /ORGANISM="Pyramimonas obovata, Strain CCMP722" /LENGTH=433 /DNA_ID=CAMNT_0006879777 /DNA_START=199 /DNA_END=1500 /DNA_ORIENTATION=-
MVRVDASATSESSGNVSSKELDSRGGAFVQHCDFTLQGSAEGPLAGLTFAIKDLFDVKGFKTGFGNPTWLETHEVADRTAPAVQMLLDAGATAIGKTEMDELAYSLNGENFHYGTPLNPAAPHRVPGGSSSGSASAVAQKLCDFALGSDTGGSVRVPSSYCGLCGIRPTHGRVDDDCGRHLAYSFDTVGWFTRDMELLQKVGTVLLDSNRKEGSIRRWLVATDAFELADKEVGSTIYKALSGEDSSTFEKITDLIGKPVETTVAPEDSTVIGPLTTWWTTFRVLQASEVWATHGEWVTEFKPNFGPGIKDRFEMASKITPEEVKAADATRDAITKHLDELLSDGAVLMVPTTPGPGPIHNMPPKDLDDFRTRALTLTCISGLARLPQVNVPIAMMEDGSPVGLGLIGARGSDEALLELAVEIEKLVPLKPSRK